MPVAAFASTRALTLDAELLDTPTAHAIAAASPLTSSALTWARKSISTYRLTWRGKDARAVITPGEIAYWPQGPAIAIGFGRTPISKGGRRAGEPLQRLRRRPLAT